MNMAGHHCRDDELLAGRSLALILRIRTHLRVDDHFRRPGIHIYSVHPRAMLLFRLSAGPSFLDGVLCCVPNPALLILPQVGLGCLLTRLHLTCS